MGKNIVKINGDILRKRIEEETGLSIYEVSEREGFSRNFLAETCRRGTATASARILAKRCNVDLSEYEKKDKLVQMSIEDIEPFKCIDLNADEVANMLREAIEKATAALENLSLSVELLRLDFNKAREAKK